jgi:hypothetical protein
LDGYAAALLKRAARLVVDTEYLEFAFFSAVEDA